MIDKTYRCNLCRETKHEGELYGIYYEGGDFILKSQFDTQNHLCLRCLKSAAACYDEVLEQQD